MPSETIDFKSFSSSLYSSEDICSSKERQASLWKSDNMPNCYDFDQGIKTSLNVQSLSHLSDSSKVNVVATQHESSLFSSSLSELFSRKLRLSANNALYGHSVDTVASHYEEERLFDSLEELEAQIIGNLLPSDDDLLSGVTNGLDHIIQDSSGDDTDELDLFSSVGGMDLGHDNCSSSEQKNSEILDEACNSQLGLRSASIAGEQPYSEHPSRTIVVRNINSQHKESNVYLHQNSLPLKSPTSFPGLHGISKSGKLDGGRVLGVEPAICTPSPETAFFHGVSSSVPNSLPSLVRVKSADNRCEVTESGSPGQLNFDSQAAPAFHPHSLPEFHDGLANSVHHIPPEVAANINLKTQERIDNMQFCQVNSNGRFMEFNECVFKSSGNGSCPLPGHHYKWGNSYQPPGMMWPNSPSYIDGVCAATNLPRLHGLPRSPSHMMATVLPINGQHVPSAPFWDRRHTYAGESLGNMQFSGNTAAHCVDFVSYNIFPHFGGNCVDLRVLPKNLGVHFHNQGDLMFPRRNHMINSFETHKQRTRSRRNEGLPNLDDKKQYELDIDRIKKGEDNRTTLMIKNIPNKYTSKMLLAAIDERHRGTYDFVYLPIDFRNKCNVGYAFINMINPGLIIPFYQVFDGKKWEKFNSEKVASLAYARIQGKAALIAHFQNSSLMNEDKRCRPILFNTDGPNAGDQVPFPVGINIRNKAGRVRNNTQEDNLQGSRSLPNLGISKLSSDGDSHSLESD
ncbi:hypothetical protein GLYMA_08G257400v4 [Glycine max]|uniref:Mei2-like C-terminal RNA recognition motif domain-containing protein n=3 Tax=Glycine subgen. Soja TaxID=1462606 RepID=K7L8W6_SOYBN|nr:protein MEI2-like 4 [Glycine max]XP_028245148.1 protein MEI2-like 4 [Glycine soja]KAH1053097.1 hypothetical protein GYH30_022408 [Glycine max]KRH45198.1 hypothetical protein GLYMA_08G257400v4 [Glycine max]RZB98839.1 Protein MEI2-like 4 isoform A [Glycine soja]|eukprot:XP_006585836.1 protein MEI2-like 4 [Glycine max]